MATQENLIHVDPSSIYLVDYQQEYHEQDDVWQTPEMVSDFFFLTIDIYEMLGQ